MQARLQAGKWVPRSLDVASTDNAVATVLKSDFSEGGQRVLVYNPVWGK